VKKTLALLLLGLALVASGCGGGGEESAPTVPDIQVDTTGGASDTGCREVETPPAKPEGSLKAPQEILNVEQTYEVTVKTSCGDFTITLDPKASPKTTASFVALAEGDFYDNTFFHRIVPGFVIQGGDPQGTGLGGPGYSTVDTPAKTTTYELGVVAMA